MRWLIWTILAVVALGAIGFFYLQSRLSAPVMSDSVVSELRAEAAAQNESAFDAPQPEPAIYPAPSATKNVYFGDLHVHSAISFDSYIFGNRLSLDDAYRFARGELVENAVGEEMQLTRPLDFVAITDHAEGFGLHEACDLADMSDELQAYCDRMERPDARFFLELRAQGEQRPPQPVLDGYLGSVEAANALKSATWRRVVEAADRHNQPGELTTFAAYEYSPPLPDRGKIHRNVIFRGSDTPSHAPSAFDALTELDLWRQLNTLCSGTCEYLTIPHNPNKSWGLAFASQTIDGDPYTEADWRLRDAVEPIVEMFQVKGNSECVIGFGTTDEDCAFEQFLPVCEEDLETGCISSTSMVRDGLKKGLALEDELGFNPLAVGLIGSTDVHNSNPGDAEEWDYRGASGALSAPAKTRLTAPRARSLNNNPGGLAAIWATENTRDALFNSMQRKEVYATSGTRIGLRFFGGFSLSPSMMDAPDLLEQAYASGVPMGSTLPSEGDEVPTFLLWAVRDPLSAPLDRIQIIKAWTQNGEPYETVFDVACSDGRAPDVQSAQCPKTQASVDLSDCSFATDLGAASLKQVWTDTDYAADQNAVYYVRVIENPTCRWSTYDSLRLGQDPVSIITPTIQEMAWSSPIWISPN
ncbi:MAG: DUF3604 domain-containing protein [Pseudomonadota bacterium]